MGCCSSGDDEANKNANANKEINKELDIFGDDDDKTYKLLLLGAGESGKSTILKQIQKIQDQNVNEEMLELAVPKLHKNLFVNMQSLIKTADQLYQNHKIEKCKISEDLSTICKKIVEMQLAQQRTSFTEKDRNMFRQLLNDDGIQYTLNTHSHRCVGLSDNAEKLFEGIDRYCREDFKPTFEDYVFIRSRTTGVSKIDCEFKNKEKLTEKFVVYDVGGQRNERRKWLELFNDVKAVIFVCAISGFNQVLFEDITQNRLRESWTLFDKTANDPAFDKPEIKIILFLNKNDLFEDKIIQKKIPFKDYIQEYDDENDVNKIRLYIKNKFEQLNRPEKRPKKTNYSSYSSYKS